MQSKAPVFTQLGLPSRVHVEYARPMRAPCFLALALLTTGCDHQCGGLHEPYCRDFDSPTDSGDSSDSGVPPDAPGPNYASGEQPVGDTLAGQVRFAMDVANEEGFEVLGLIGASCAPVDAETGSSAGAYCLVSLYGSSNNSYVLCRMGMGGDHCEQRTQACGNTPLSDWKIDSSDLPALLDVWPGDDWVAVTTLSQARSQCSINVNGDPHIPDDLAGLRAGVFVYGFSDGTQPGLFASLDGQTGEVWYP